MTGSTEDRLRTEAVFKGGLGLRIQVRKGGGGKDVLCIGWHAKDGGRGRRRERGGGVFLVWRAARILSSILLLLKNLHDIFW